MRDTLRVDVGKRIRHFRKMAHLTQENLGDKAGLSYKFIGEIERGEVNPSLDSLSGIAKALKVNVRDLLPGETDFLSNFSAQDIQLIAQAAGLLNKKLNPAKKQK